MFITVEGPIGVGKTTLANLLSKELGFELEREIIFDNPFLPNFMEDPENYAFQTEMFFLTNRYVQLGNIDERLANDTIGIVSDYDIMKMKIFTKNTLHNGDYDKFLKIYDVMMSSVRNTDLHIILNANLNTIKERIFERGRDGEENYSDDYLQYLIDEYKNHIDMLKSSGANYIEVDYDKYDILHNQSDKNYILGIIKDNIKCIK